jgi:hypothetical protein
MGSSSHYKQIEVVGRKPQTADVTQSTSRCCGTSGLQRRPADRLPVASIKRSENREIK